jgi:hypothetical protein
MYRISLLYHSSISESGGWQWVAAARNVRF